MERESRGFLFEVGSHMPLFSREPQHNSFCTSQQQAFQFPDIFPEKEKQHEEDSVEAMQEKFMEDERQRQKPDPRRGGVTEWFGL
ncbi:39S ribosomal protein L23, mitochondrial [Tachysurus ichikawai]